MNRLLQSLKALKWLPLAGAVACASTKIIETQPPGARVFVDGQYVGTTPYELTARRVFWQKKVIRVKKEGYHPQDFVASRGERLNPGAFIGGFFFWPLFFWAGAYDDETTLYLSPDLAAPAMAASDSTDAVVPPAPKTLEERRATLERMYESGALTKKEYEAELDWLEELEAEQKEGASEE